MTGKLVINAIVFNTTMYCKLSGLFTEATWKTWSAAGFYPYLDIVFKALEQTADVWQRLACNASFR